MSDIEDHIKEEDEEEQNVDVSSAKSDVDSDAEEELFVEKGTTAHIEPPLALQLFTNLDKMLCYRCDSDTNFSQRQCVAIKEKAIFDAVMIHLPTLLKELMAVQPKISTHHHVETVNKLKAKYMGAVILIGLVGSTGAGKSSFINALLGFKDLLPADDGAAVTAAVIKMLWNDDDDPAKSLRAVVEFNTKEELKAELNTLATDIEDEDNDEPDAEPDVERDERIQRTLQWVHGIFPFINSKREFSKHTISELVNHASLKDFLGQVKQIENSVVKKFSAAIKPYISVLDKSDNALWPIVKEVRIYTKSPILREGICLVDLPGVADTNTARGAIAEKVHRELHVTLIVAESLRAESNKNAQDLLGSVRQRTLKLDNQFATDKLAFAMSKCDNQLTTDRYVTNHLKSDSRVMADLEKKEKVDEMKLIADIHYKKKKDEVGNLNSRIATMRKRLTSLEILDGVPQKRKFEHEDLAKDEEAEKLKQDIKKAEQERLEVKSDCMAAGDKVEELTNYIDQCKSRMTKACITHRHEKSAKAIREDYARASKNTTIKSNRPLRVFSISANAYFERLEGGEPLGFPTDVETGIPAVKNWFVKLTLKGRKEHNARLLQEIVGLEKSLDISLASSAMGHKMSQEESDEILESFGLKKGDLLMKLSADNSAAAGKIDHLITYYLFKKMPENERTAVKNVKDVVRANGQDINWQIFRTTNKRMGKYTCIKGKDTRTHDFNANMAGAYFDPLMDHWCETIHERVPESRVIYENNTQDHVEEFIAEVIKMAEDQCPQIACQLKTWGESAKEVIEIIRNNAVEVFDVTIKEWVKDTHPLMDKEIQKLWENTYTACGDATGTGHFKLSKKAHMEFIRTTAAKMFKKGSKAMRNHLKILFSSLADEFDKGTAKAVRRMEQEFKELLENHTAVDGEDADQSKFQKEKSNLRLVSNGVFKAIAEDWQKPMEFKAIKEEVVEDLPFPSLDGLYGSKGKD